MMESSNLPYFQSRSLIRLISIILPVAFFCITSCVSSSSSDDDFIKNSCGVTRYPDLCYQTLSAYASSVQGNPTQLANAALTVTLESAQSTTNFVLKMMKSHNLKPKEAVAMKDCVETLKDSVDELRESLEVMRDLEGPEFAMKMSNIQTWVSAALTNEDTCLSGFEGKLMNGNVKDTLRSYLERVAQLTSNGLALINQLV